MKMFQFDVTVAGNFNKVVEAIGATEAQIRTAAVRAINKTALWIKSQGARKISNEDKIKLKLIRQQLRVVKANREALKAFIIGNFRGITAIKLGHPRRTASGITVGVHKFPGAFIARMPKRGATTAAGHIGIFKRKTRRRLPIQELSVPIGTHASDIIRHYVDDEAPAVFMRYFEHEVRYATSTP
jgi:hypothetical protein